MGKGSKMKEGGHKQLEPKQDQNSARYIFNFVAPCPASEASRDIVWILKGLGGPGLKTLPIVVLKASLLGWLCWFLMDFLRYSTSEWKSFPTVWDLCCTSCLILTVACSASSRAHYLASHAFFWGWSGFLHDPVSLAFCMPVMPELWMRPKSSANSSTGQASFNQSYWGFQVSGWYSTVNWIPQNKFPGWSYSSTVCWDFLLTTRSFTTFAILRLGRTWIYWFQTCAQTIFFIVLIQSTGLLFNANVFSSQALHSNFAGPNCTWASVLAK